MIDSKFTTGIFAALLVLLATAAPADVQAQTMDDKTYSYILFDHFEYVPGASERPIELGGTAWIGGDINRLWLRGGGEQSTLETAGEGELEALYGRLITPFFDAVIGARMDRRWGESGAATRGFLAAGVQGLAPYWFEVEPTLYVSHDGDLSAHLAASYELLFTQRLILEPEVELSAALQEVPEWGVGSGVNDLGAGLRLRYEISRKFAPYVGYDWSRAFQETADFARAEGEDVSRGMFVFGVRLWR